VRLRGKYFQRLFQLASNFLKSDGSNHQFEVSPRGPGHGVWEHLTDGHYSYSVKFFVFNANGTLAGSRIEMRNVVVDVSGSSYTATGTSQLYDVNGTPTGPPICATETPTRFQ
jgi:hypothetical protein